MSLKQFVKELLGFAYTISLLFGTETESTVHTYLLGEEKVWVHIYQRPGIDMTLINLHDNENSAAKAGLEFIRKHGGRLIEVKHGRGREVVVRLDGKLNRFDPNRMFSNRGLKESLRYFHNNTREIFNHAITFRDSLLHLMAIENNKIIVSVHNNTPDKMTIHDFLPGELYGNDIEKVFINPSQDHDDFFVVANEEIYSALKRRDYNVALHTKKPSDRGMLINYCSTLGAICITVEAEHGKVVKQVEMLEVLWEILRYTGHGHTPD